MNLSRFNRQGLVAFSGFLEEVREGRRSDTPNGMLVDPALTETISDSEEISRDRVFDTRLQMALYLDPILNNVFDGDDMNETGVWAWLSAAFFDTVCPEDDSGIRRPGRDYRHIPSEDWRHFYRHLIRGPIRIYRLFAQKPENALIVLCQHPAAPGEFVEQLAARQERITNPGIIEAANRLYFDGEIGKPRRGSAPNWPKPGTLRRFGQLLDQLDLTYDLYSMSADDLLELLPGEFSAQGS